MTLGPLPAFAAALAGNAILSLGMVLQKRHVAFVGGRGPESRRNRGGWILGFLLSNLSPPFTFLALLGLPANVVAAANGSNVAFATLFSALLLGERISGRQIFFTIALFSALGLAGLRGAEGEGEPSRLVAILAFALPLLLAAVLLLARRRRRGGAIAVAIGATAGALAGYMILPLKLLGAASGLAAWIFAPWLWLYALSGLFSVAIVQAAYKDASMKRVAPAFYGLQVLWPALASTLAFGLPLDPWQGLAFAGIALCVLAIAGGGEGGPGLEGGGKRGRSASG